MYPLALSPIGPFGSRLSGFGDLEFGKILGLLMIGSAGGAIFGGPSAAWIFDTTGSYAGSFILAAIAAALSAVLTLLVRPHWLHGEFVTQKVEKL